MPDYPCFSVAMSVYAGDVPEQLREALSSVCNQSYKPNEIFVVIDGPISDELEDVMTEYSERYGNFTFYRFEENKGLGIALQTIVEKCKYDLIIRMDSDDISAPGRFKKLLDAYCEEPVDVLGSWTLGFVGDIETGRVSAARKKLTHDEIVRMLPHKTPMSHVSVLFRREAVLKAGNYQHLFYHEDYYLWARMIQAGCTFRNIPEYLVYVRLGENQAKRHGGVRYFKAGHFLRRFMLKNRLMTRKEFVEETILRVVYQLLLTPSLRSWVSMQFRRKALTRSEINRILSGNELYENNQRNS